MNNHKTVYLTCSYLPPVQYYCKLLAYDRVYVEQYDHYIKQTYRNRCLIAGPGGIFTLSIPVVRPENQKCLMKDIRISDHGNWRHLHWNALESAYNSSPFFEYYKDDLKPFYENKTEYLFDFNEQLNRLLCRLIDIETPVKYTSAYQTDFPVDIADFRERIHPKKSYIPEDTEFIPHPYYQVFESKNGFLPNLSIVDLLFNMGPESILVLQKSITL